MTKICISDWKELVPVVSVNAQHLLKTSNRLNTAVGWGVVITAAGGYLLYQQNQKIKKLEKEVSDLKRDKLKEKFEKG